MGLSFTKREIRLQSGILHYKMGFLGYKRDSRVAIHHLLQEDVLEKISWNFKHIVNVKTIRGVRAITNMEGYKMIEI